MKSPHAALVLSGVLLACTGCQGGPGPATGTPVSSATQASSSIGTPSAPVTASVVPSPQCTPELGGPASPCTQQQYDAMKAKDAQYAEAERVYRAFFDVDQQVTKSGQLAPTVVSDYLAEPALATYTSRHAEQHAKGLTGTGTIALAWLRRSAPEQGALVSISSCVDGTGLGVHSSAGDQGAGVRFEAVMSFKESEGKLKIFRQTSKEVTKC